MIPLSSVWVVRVALDKTIPLFGLSYIESLIQLWVELLRYVVVVVVAALLVKIAISIGTRCRQITLMGVGSHVDYIPNQSCHYYCLTALCLQISHQVFKRTTVH